MSATECDRCDGCGWHEGGATLQTRCEECNGTGVVNGAIHPTQTSDFGTATIGGETTATGPCGECVGKGCDVCEGYGIFFRLVGASDGAPNTMTIYEGDGPLSAFERGKITDPSRMLQLGPVARRWLTRYEATVAAMEVREAQWQGKWAETIDTYSALLRAETDRAVAAESRPSSPS